MRKTKTKTKRKLLPLLLSLQFVWGFGFGSATTTTRRTQKKTNSLIMIVCFDVLQKWYRVRKTISEMFLDRGYTLLDNLGTFDEFHKFVTRADGYEDLMMVAEKQDGNIVTVHFPKPPKVGVKDIRNYINEASEEDGKKHIILVYKASITPFAKKELTKICNSGNVVVETFHIRRFLINITKHKFVPRHEKVDLSKVKSLPPYLKDPTKLPKILSNDPVSCYYFFQPGDVIKIRRHNIEGHFEIVYRIVVDS